jgi:caa(3)-type oxidase subunit IV
MSASHANPYRIYWITWALLLVVTVSMLGAEAFHMPRWLLVPFLLTFMMLKAVMIGGNFMHLRFEKSNLGLMVFTGIMVTTLILFLYITPESKHVLDRTIR